MIKNLINQVLSKPYKLIWLVIPIILGLSTIGSNGSIDIQMHDTYFVISSFHIGILFSIILGIIGFIYWLVKGKKLVNWMTAIHLLTTILALASILIISFLPNGLFSPSSYSFDTISDLTNNPFSTASQILSALVLMAILSQLLFIVNVIMSFARNHNKI